VHGSMRDMYITGAINQVCFTVLTSIGVKAVSHESTPRLPRWPHRIRLARSVHEYQSETDLSKHKTRILFSAVGLILLASVARDHRQENVDPDNKPSWNREPSVPASTETPHSIPVLMAPHHRVG
jgi:hypothetical protein